MLKYNVTNNIMNIITVQNYLNLAWLFLTLRRESYRTLTVSADKLFPHVYTHTRNYFFYQNKKFKGRNIGIVKKAQETRFGISLKYSRYIG